MSGPQLLTHSRMACAKACLRRHYYAYELGLRPIRESTPLRIGSAFHLGLEVYGTASAATFEDAVLNAIRLATEGYDQTPGWVTDPLEWAEQRDVDNVQKALIDALEHAGAYADDSQIVKLVTEKHEVFPRGKAVVRLTEYAPSAEPSAQHEGT